MQNFRLLTIFAVMLAASCGPAQEPAEAEEKAESQSLIYAWMFDSQQEAPNFLAVIDADAASKRYGEILETVAAGKIRGDAHHTNFTLPNSGKLFANDFMGNGTYIFDTGDPRHPVLAGSFKNQGDYSFAHTFVELPNGNTLATFQTRGEADDLPGGLVELTAAGEFVQEGSADPADPEIFIRPYSITLLPDLDRAVTTVTDMKAADVGRHIQIWRLSNLELLHTLPVTVPEGGREGSADHPFEIRLLADGKTVMVVTLACGLYTVTGVDSESPQISFVHDFEADFCFVPARLGPYWVQTVIDGDLAEFERGEGLIEVLDVSDPGSPVKVDRLGFPVGTVPHWLSPDAEGRRLVMTGYGTYLSRRIMMLDFDPDNGKITLDETFGAGDAAGPGLMISHIERPEAAPGPVIAHGTVFWPAAPPSWKN